MKNQKLLTKKYAGFLLTLTPVVLAIVITVACQGILRLCSIEGSAAETLTLSVGSACGIASYMLLAMWVVKKG